MKSDQIAELSTESLLEELRRRLMAHSEGSMVETPTEAILRIVARCWAIRQGHLSNNDRSCEYVFARAAGMVLMRRLGMSLHRIAQQFKKDHSLVAYNVQQHDARMLSVEYSRNFTRAEAAFAKWENDQNF